MIPGEPYEDDTFVELPDETMPSATPDYYYFFLFRKTHGDKFRILAKDREELAMKVRIGAWDLDPRNYGYDPDEDDEDETKPR